MERVYVHAGGRERSTQLHDVRPDAGERRAHRSRVEGDV